MTQQSKARYNVYHVTVEKAHAEYLSAHNKALDEAERRLAQKVKKLKTASTVDSKQ